ncbi:hypothetical protein Q5P01_012814 [Channa striata]|uniref:Uncharacterized protein n=1 Tax=Channa striata TaxID=64152 RepID=A0AA88MSI0_CHASR|nr:hypothetical protein Q5P01_012814 [Channa striata]
MFRIEQDFKHRWVRSLHTRHPLLTRSVVKVSQASSSGERRRGSAGGRRRDSSSPDYDRATETGSYLPRSRGDLSGRIRGAGCYARRRVPAVKPEVSEPEAHSPPASSSSEKRGFKAGTLDGAARRGGVGMS